MNNKLIKQIVMVNLFMSVFIYLPIFIPFDTYIAAHNMMFRLATIHLMSIFAVLFGAAALER